MSDLGEPDAFRRTTTLGEPEVVEAGGGCGAPWFWIILFVIALLVIIALIVALVYAVRRITKGRNLEFKGAVIKVGKDGSTLTANWPATSKNNDKVTLWATLDPPQFESDGKVLNSNVKSITAASGVNSVTLTGLNPGIKYYATLTVVNSDTFNYQVYTQLVYMDGLTPATTTNPNNTFAIEDIIQVGRIQLENDNVLFNQKPNTSGALWYVDSDSTIKNEDNPTMCLYNNNGVLAAADCADSPVTKANSQWTYNGGKLSNQWCLSSTINNENPTCMVLENISKGTATVSVKTDVNAGDAWANAFEIPKTT